MDNINNLYYKLFICKDCSQSIKEYEESNENPKNILNFGYVQIYDNLTPNLILRTPPMVCIFGLNKKYWSINLQFTNYKNDKIMNSFLKLLENIDNFKEENDFTWLSSQCTTSVYQVMDIKNIISSFLDLNVDSTDGYIVQSPNYIDPAILMHNFSEDVIKDIDETIHFLKGKVESIKNSNFDPYDAQSDNVNSDYRNSLKPLLGHWDELDLYGKRVFSNLELLGTIKKWMLTHKSPYFDYKRFLVYLKKTDMIWKQNFNDFYPNYKFENKELHRVN